MPSTKIIVVNSVDAIDKYFMDCLKNIGPKTDLGHTEFIFSNSRVHIH